MMCRRLAFCVLALVGVMALASCSGDSGDEASAPTTTQDSSGGETGGESGGDAAADVDWCTVLDKAEIEAQFGEGGAVSEGTPDDVVAGCEWEVGEDQSAPGTGAINVSNPVGASVGSPEERFAEYKALCQPEKQEDEQFSATSCERSKISDGVASCVDRLIRVDRLAETRALVGISRLDGETDRNALSLKRKNWLPANRVYGEGIFLTLDERLIEKWSSKKQVLDRAEKVTARQNQVAASRKRGRPRMLLPKFYLLHTFAHVLIRQLSFECGYGSSSLRERIYCNEGDGSGSSMSGILIYTAAGDCEGTLGGLVRQSEPETFGRLVKDALQSAIWCSADPLCIESKGQGADSLNLAACHACALLPETSCEEGNRLLDRAFLIGTPDNPEMGFFAGLVG